ncbi:uncharacterized protein TNCV_2395411 [Trichonephila clavipes]|nr:uncharacterized protein TNCV_2395411 [Trichonephila clavipes]
MEFYDGSRNFEQHSSNEKDTSVSTTIPNPRAMSMGEFLAHEGMTSITVAQHAARGLLATDHVILDHGQVTWTTPELAPPLLITTPLQREDVSALDRFNVHRCPIGWVFSGTEIELVTRQDTVRYLYHSATAAPKDVKLTYLIQKY